MAAGNFTPSALLAIKLKAEKMWSDAQMNADYIPQSVAAQVILKKQTATFRELDNPEKDRTIEVNWIKDCDLAVVDGTSNCSLNGIEAETVKKTVQFDIEKEVTFSVNAEKLRTNIYDLDEVVARRMAMSIKKLDEWWAMQSLVKLKAFTSANLAPKPFIHNAVKNCTVVPNAHYGTFGTYSGLQLPTLFAKMMIQNKINDAYYIDNGRMWMEYQNTMISKGSTDQIAVSGVGRAEALKVDFDLFNFAQGGITNVTTFAVGRGAVAMKTYNRNQDAPTPVIGDNFTQTRYTVPSISLQGVKYDVYYALTCTTVNGKENLMHTFKIKTIGGIWLNPEACPVTVQAGTANLPAGTYTPTGVIAFCADDEIV